MDKKVSEKIGKVLLDLSLYSGSDAYSDGVIEEHLLDIVINTPRNEFNHIIAQEKDWAVMYHLSHLRRNIVDLFPISNEDSVLEIGAGCGAVTGALAEKAKQVVCVELSKQRSMINAYQNKEFENIEIKVGNYIDIEKGLDKFDWITLIGVLEYAGKYIEASHDSDPFSMLLRTVISHLKPNGKVILAIENQYGMKYFSGFREDHNGELFSGIQGYEDNSEIRTFSKEQLSRYIEKSGLKIINWFYPYPDYKLPVLIYSDEYLPKYSFAGDAISRNFDTSRVELFSESIAFRNAISAGMFTYFANSFLLEMGI